MTNVTSNRGGGDPILFSVLIPSIPSRVQRFLQPLCENLVRQARARLDVEIISLLDNQVRSIGEKRDALIQLAQGKYLAFVDDDDDVSGDYVESITDCLDKNPNVDVVVFNQQATINDGNPFIVRYGLEYTQNQQACHDLSGRWLDITRPPWHICAWKSSIAKSHRFPNSSYGEDWEWVQALIREAKTQARVDKALHYYRFDDTVSEAPSPEAESTE